MPAIELENLTKFYGKTPAVLQASLQVEQGEFFGFVGPNGSGKTTTIRILLNFLRPTSGSARILSMDTVKQSEEIKRILGYVPSELDYFQNLRAWDVFRLALRLRKSTRRQKIEELCALFEVDEKRSIARMSLGNRKKVALVLALFDEPQVLVLDEACAFLDPFVKTRFKEYLKQENQKGVTIFFCSHDMMEVQELCTRAALIRRGSILEVLNLSDFSQLRSRRVKLKTQSDLSALFTYFHIDHVTPVGDYVSFSFDGEMDALVKALGSFAVEDLQIGLPSLQDTIVQFYEKQMKQEETQA